MVDNVVRRDQILDVLVLDLLVFSERDAGGEVDVTIEVDHLYHDLADVADLVVRGERDLVLGVGDSFLGGRGST